MKKKLFTMLSVVLMLCLLPALALAEETTPTDTSTPNETQGKMAEIVATGDQYDTLKEAVEAVADNTATEIKLLRDVEDGDGIIVKTGKIITFDFNNKTYTVTKNLAGSTGYESQCFQLLKDSTVTMKNGTIQAGTSGVAILIQNYSNLTLENMTLDGTTMTCSGGSYALSNNHGDVTIAAGTTITAQAGEGNVAMDVCWADSYPAGAHVTVQEGAVINGTLELGLWDEQNYEQVTSNLKIEGGTVNGELTLDSTVTAEEQKTAIQYLGESSKVEISGGSFSAPVQAAYLAEGLNYQAAAQDGETTMYSYHATPDAAQIAAGKDGTVEVVSADETTAPTTFTVTLDAGEGTLTGAASVPVIENTEYTVPTATRSGYTLRCWQIWQSNADSDELADTGETVNAGAKYTVTADTKLVAVWNKKSSSHSSSAKSYAVIIDNVKNGDVTVSPKSAVKGKTVTITVEPAEGYELDELTVTDANGKTVKVTEDKNGKYTFTMPESKTTVKAAFAKIDAAKPDDKTAFADVKASAWYAEPVQYVADKGMMKGTNGNNFSPNDNTTRAQIVTVLYRLENEPAAGTAAFTDVAADQYYAKAVAWAAEKKVVKGYTETAFAPNDSITREQIAAILFRYADFKGIAAKADGNLTAFTDAAKVSAWAEDAMKWAVGCGLLQGDNGALNPQGNASRAEIAMMLMRFCENVAK